MTMPYYAPLYFSCIENRIISYFKMFYGMPLVIGKGRDVDGCKTCLLGPLDSYDTSVSILTLHPCPTSNSNYIQSVKFIRTERPASPFTDKSIKKYLQNPSSSPLRTT